MLDHCDPDYTIAHQRIHLAILSVHPEAMGQGVGSALLDHLADYCRSNGYEEISVGVNLDNQIARNLYEKKGFTFVLGQGQDQDGDYLKLLKRLNSLQG